MKVILLTLAISFFMAPSFGQMPGTTTHSKDYYLEKSKKQRTAGWVILGTGLGIAAAGGIVQLQHENSSSSGWGFDFDFTGAYIAIGGGVVCLSSIPFFISASANKKRAASIAVGNQSILLPSSNRFAFKTQPAVTLRIQL